ncbi:MAG: arginase family protein, partial [Proteobacteria bacterium]|nr:arginase family protein [Pseudomonadota bacterium]
MTSEQVVAQHYAHGSLEQAILKALEAAGKDLNQLSLKDLSPVDEFHIGGRLATIEFAKQLGLRPGMRILDMEEFHDRGWAFAAAEARRVVGEGPVYLTYDIDSLDPAQAPGTGTPEAGGIQAIEALRLLRGLRGLDFVGGDLVEVAPGFDPGTLTAFNGAS